MNSPTDPSRTHNPRLVVSLEAAREARKACDVCGEPRRTYGCGPWTESVSFAVWRCLGVIVSDAGLFALKGMSALQEVALRREGALLAFGREFRAMWTREVEELALRDARARVAREDAK